MENTSENYKWNNPVCIGILAHVDAGKTTLSESLLYRSGQIRKLGRVDNQDAFLDTYDLERKRGITIFSKQAVFRTENRVYCLLDTPGHVDFSAEMERTLQVLDYGILVINGADGPQGHTYTLWKLLEQYHIPVFLFVNKMDQPGTDREKLLAELKRRLSGSCVDFSPKQPREQWLENTAVCDEELLEVYLETGSLSGEQIGQAVRQRKIFPCFFGSALKVEGVDEFLEGLDRYTLSADYPAEFGARVFKIARDEQGTRLTYMKITGGSLKVKDVVRGEDGELWEEKADQIRIYSGARYETAQEVFAGMVCAVTGLTHTRPGQGLGAEPSALGPVLEPVLNYRVELPEGCDPHEMLKKLRLLEEEEPMLNVLWNEELAEIHVRLMGQVQAEILKSLIRERFGVEVNLGTGNIVYKETIEEPVSGAGHYEPLRHYAEVRLRLEPTERGSGLTFATECSEDTLDRNWQRLILTHLAEKEHRGVLTGAPVTDMRITLTAGRAHLKHTEGGDFRQATYRAVRQGLKKACSILLEPYYSFTLEVPQESVGRAMSDIQKMNGVFDPPVLDGETAVLTGSAPVACMGDYQTEVAAYTRGMGRLFCALKGYEPCHNQEEVIAAADYDSERDLENPTGSVFCAHGAGFAVSWDHVEEYMHLEDPDRRREEPEEAQPLPSRDSYARYQQNEEELRAIFERTYGPVKRRVGSQYGGQSSGTAGRKAAEGSGMRQGGRATPGRNAGAALREQYLLVDGYNIIFAWDELKELAQVNVDSARTKLMDILSNYQGYKKCVVILVFDAYKVEGFQGEVSRYHNIYVVYTKEAETADQYIEKTVHRIGHDSQVTVATSDRLEQVIILGQGGRRMSARDLYEEIRLTNEEIRRESRSRRQSGRNYLFNYLDDETADYMEEIRLGRREPGTPPEGDGRGEGQEGEDGKKPK